MADDRSLFRFSPMDSIAPQVLVPETPRLQRLIDDPQIPVMALPGGQGAVSLLRTTAPTVASDQDQFVVFQLSRALDGPRVLDPTQVECAIEGSDEEPDAKMAISLEAFHVAKNEPIGKSTRATMRVIVGKDKDSSDQKFDNLFWVVTSGLKLYNDFRNAPANPKELAQDYKQALGGRPAEIPGALATLHFEVVEHEKEPTWWQRVLGFAKSPAGSVLVSSLGFPAITTTAIGFLDEALNRLYDAQPKVLFRGVPMTLALSTRARKNYVSDNPYVKIGALAPGFCIMARRRDYKAIAESNAIFNRTYGSLIPADVTDADYHSGTFTDPFENITYAVLRIGMRQTQLDAGLWYGVMA